MTTDEKSNFIIGMLAGITFIVGGIFGKVFNLI